VLQEADAIKETREEHYDRYDRHCAPLRDYCKAITLVKPVVLSSIRKHKEKLFYLRAGLLAAIFTIIGVISTIVFSLLK